MQDRICIYNEVIDSIRGVFNIFKLRHKECIKQEIETGSPSDDLLRIE
jgi:hypothetical protein